MSHLFLHVSQTVTYSVCYICIWSCDLAAVIAWVSYGSSVGVSRNRMARGVVMQHKLVALAGFPLDGWLITAKQTSNDKWCTRSKIFTEPAINPMLARRGLTVHWAGGVFKCSLAHLSCRHFLWLSVIEAFLKTFRWKVMYRNVGINACLMDWPVGWGHDLHHQKQQ